jgi:DNA-binding MarR family transcriptional regulator
MSNASRTVPPPQIGALLRMAWEELQATILHGQHEAGFDDIRESHWTLLRYPGPDGLRPSELAARNGLSKQAINNLLRELEALGYVGLEPDPEDRRARIIRLTDRGWAFYELGSKLSRTVGRRWSKAVGEDRFAEFEAVLRDIVATRVQQGSSAPAGAPALRSRSTA